MSKFLEGYSDPCYALMPGLANIAVQDYAAINDAPIAGMKALQKAGMVKDD